MTEVFRLEHLSKVYRNEGKEFQALQDMNLDIREGEIFGIIGMSGAGKSTLVRTLNRLEEASAGRVFFYGQDLAKLAPGELRRTRQSIAMIFQHFNLLKQRSVLDNVMQPLRIAGKKKKEGLAKAREMLKIVGLEDKEKTYPSHLSGGQQQRVAIARALAADPKVLLCDEATSALDPSMTEEILQLLKEINEQRKLTIVMITHEMAVVEKICHRVAILDQGELAEVGEVKKIFQNPSSLAAKKLVFPSNPFDPSKKSNRVIRIVFDGLAASRPFIADLVEQTGLKVNILSANTKSVGGIGYGQMVLELPDRREDQETIIDFFQTSGLSLQEVERE